MKTCLISSLFTGLYLRIHYHAIFAAKELTFEDKTMNNHH